MNGTRDGSNTQLDQWWLPTNTGIDGKLPKLARDVLVASGDEEFNVVDDLEYGPAPKC